MPTLPLTTTEQVLRAAGEPTRLRLLHLCARGELAVSDLTQTLQQSQPRVSRHLKILCDAGLLERFRDGQWVYFRLPLHGERARAARHLLALTDPDDAQVSADAARLTELLGEQQSPAADPALRRFNRLILDQFLSAPVGELLDIGVGSGAILKLLASKARRAVGVDIDAGSRIRARRSFARASIAHCTIRPGDMMSLDYDAASFDTVVLDEVLLESRAPATVIAEAARVLRPSGRLLLIEHVDDASRLTAAAELGALAGAAGLRCGPVRQSVDGHQHYLVTVAVANEQDKRQPA